MDSATSPNRALIIVAFDEIPYQRGFFQVSQKYFDDVKRLFPEITELKTHEVSRIIGIFGPSKFDDYKALQLKVKEITQSSSSLQIKMEKEGETSLTSKEVKTQVRSAVRKSTSWDGNGFLPLVCVLQEEKIQQMLDGRLNQLKELLSANDWKGIYNLYQPVENLRHKPEIWNNAEILSTIGFACQKLSEVAEIPREISQDYPKKREYLNQLKKYRRECQTLYQRCVELEPENPRHYSNLGYHHYQNVIQLKTPRGRRDGDIPEEAEQALKYLDKALSFSEDRLNDLYRKGYLLASILPTQLTYGGSVSRLNLTAEQAREQGIACLEKLIEYWNELPDEEEKKKRFRKEYIKSLYNLGQAYYARVRNPWDEISVVLKLKLGQPLPDGNLRRDLENAQKAWDTLYQCWQADQPNPERRLDESNLRATPAAGVEEGVFRLYWLGKAAFLKYWILSYYGMSKSPKALPYAEKAMKFLQAALDLPWSSKSANQRKDFVVELLARIHLALGEPQKAVQLLEGKIKTMRDPYILNTYAMALTLTGNYKKAGEILEDNRKNQNNRDHWTSTMLLGCNHLLDEKYDEAKKIFTDLTENSNNKIKLAYCWVGLAFVAFQSQDVKSAIQKLQKAVDINPYHLGLRQTLMEWKRQRS